MATQTFVNVQTTKLTDNEVTPIENAIISGIMRDTGVANGIIAGGLNGLAARAHRYQRFGSDPNRWDAGLPEVQMGTVNYSQFGLNVTGLVSHPSTFYPMTTIRQDKQFLTADSDPNLHQQTKRLMKRVAINLDDLIANIEDDDRTNEDGTPVTEPNPVNDLEDIFFGFTLDLYSTQEKSAEYMYDFWEVTAPLLQVNQSTYDSSTGSTRNAIKFQGAGQHEMYWFVGYAIHTETIGDLVDEEGKAVSATVNVILGSVTLDPVNLFQRNDSSSIVYSKQLRPGVIGKWTVGDIQQWTFVDTYTVDPEEEMLVIRGIADLQFSGPTGTYDTYHELTPTDLDFGRSGFYIPVSYDILETFSAKNEEKVLADAMMIIMHAAVEVNLKWYQSQWFKVVMIIIIAVITYFSFGTLTKEAMWSLKFFTELAIQFGLAYIVQYLVQEIGGTLGIILALAVAYYGVSRGNYTNVDNLLPYAKEVLQVTRVGSQVLTAHTKKQAELLQEDKDELQIKVEEFQDELEALYSELGRNKYDPAWLIEKEHRYPPKRSVTNFYNLAKTTNVAGIVKSGISEYHSRMKTLPRYLNNEEMITG